MDASITRALSELPEGIDPPDATAAPQPASEVLRRVAEEAGRGPLPQGRMHRGWILGSLYARVAAGYLTGWVRRALAAKDEKERLRHEAHLRAAVQCLGTMTHLRGAVMKAGQLLASWPTLAPKEFAETLATLHFEAPPMHASLIEEVLRAELGAPPETVFAEFDPRPFAAASLGQVHRARLRSGEAVAVKVQYPGIARAIRSDLANLELLLLPMRFTKDWAILREQLDDVAATLARETDYEEEATFQERAREALAGLPNVVVPRVHRELSTDRVLTSDLLRGKHLDAYLETKPSAEDRSLRGHQVMEAAFRLYYARFCYADPSPGNFLFLDDGRLGLLDFGCCRVLDDDDWKVLWLMEEAFRGGDDAWERGIRASTRTGPEASLSPEQDRALHVMADWMWEPLRQPGLFDFGSNDYFPRGVTALRDVLGTRATRSTPVFTWVQRSLIGLRAITSRLGARVAMRDLHERESAGAFADLEAS